MIDMASVYAERYKQNPQALQAAVMGQSPDPKLDPYTALNALKLVKESARMTMAGQAQQPTSSPSIVAENMAPPPMMQGLGAMVPGAMGQAPQGMPQRPPTPQPTMRAASGGLAGMYTPEEDYAAGGIVAFNGEEDSFVTDPDSATDMQVLASEVDGVANPTTLSRAERAAEEYRRFEPTEMTAAEQEAFLDKYMARASRAAGPNIYAPAKEELKARREALAGDRKYNQGLTLLTAAGKVLKGRNLAEGASEALPAAAQQLGEARRAEQQEKRAIEQMNFSIADAERKERMGDARGAQAALAEARKFQQDANRAKGDKLRFSADIAARTVQYGKTSDKSAGAGPKLAEQLAAAEIAYAKDPTKENKATVDALTRAASKTRTSYSTGESGPGRLGAQQEALTSKENIAANDALAKHKLIGGKEWKKAVADAGSVEAAEAKFKKNWLTANPQTAAPAPKPNAAPKPTAAAATGKTITMADVDATVKSSGRTKQEVMDALKVKGYTVQ